eukprot:gene8487-8874_t
MASHKSVTTTVIRNEIDQVATDSKFMLSMTDQDGDGLLSMEEAREKGIDEPTFRAMDIDGDGRLTEKEVILGISNENTFRKSQVNRFKQAHRSEEDTVLIECAQKVSEGAWV